jgi:copper chaperone
MSKAVFQLEPLTCPSCIKKIESALGRTPGVESARVLFNASKVKAEFDASQTGVDELKHVIVKLGYPVVSAKAS